MLERKNLVKKAFAGLIEKRKARLSLQTKYSIRREKLPEDYKKIKIRINGKNKKLSDSGKFFLDAMTVVDKRKAGSPVEFVDGANNKQITEISDYLLDMIVKEE